MAGKTPRDGCWSALVCVCVCVGGFQVIRQLRADGTDSDFRTHTHTHISSLCSPLSLLHLPVSCLSQPAAVSKRPSDCWSDLLPAGSKPRIPIHTPHFSLPIINIFRRLTCGGCVKANERKQEIISNIKILLSKAERPFEMLYFSA